MTGKRITGILLAGSLPVLLSFSNPGSWHKGGNCPQFYEAGTAYAQGHSGMHAGTIRSVESVIPGYGTFLQSCNAEPFRGKRVRMTGFMKSKDVVDWAGLWMRVDKIHARDAEFVTVNSPSFDNMEGRPVRGTTDWAEYEVVLDVPADATVLSYGARLGKTGQIWFDDIRIEIVDRSVLLTSLPMQDTSDILRIERKKYDGEALLPRPANLDFEE